MSEFSFMANVKRTETVLQFDDHRQFLSPLLVDIQELIGMENMMKLVERWGGIDLYIPSTMSDDHRIVQEVCMKAAKDLAAIYGGDLLRLPNAYYYKKAYRDEEIYRRKKAGEPVSRMAREYGLSARAIWNSIRSVKDRILAEKYRKAMEGRKR